jgi:hypothetical protein
MINIIVIFIAKKIKIDVLRQNTTHILFYSHNPGRREILSTAISCGPTTPSIVIYQIKGKYKNEMK